MIELTNQQEEALKKAKHWWNHHTKQVFEISGVAGSGKSTLVYYLIDELNIDHDDVLFVAYVGKATLALSRKGNNAQTIHSAIYNAVDTPKLDEFGNHIIMNNRPVTTLEFVKKDALAKNIRLIVVDEAGMVSEKLALDLLSFNIPVIALGDNNQLDPLFGNRFFLENPDAELTKPMRQALDSPIVYLSQRVLDGKMLRKGKYGDSCYVIDKDMITDNMLIKSDVVICNKNKTRWELNQYIRNTILKIDAEIPKIGEKLICRQNNWKRCLLNNIYLINGLVGYVDNVYLDTYNGRSIIIDFRPEFLENDMFKKVKLDFNHLNSIPDPKNNRWSYFDKFEYGYAITTHLSQGAEWDKVFIYSEPYGTREFQKKILYTAITRAKKFLILAI